VTHNQMKKNNELVTLTQGYVSEKRVHNPSANVSMIMSHSLSGISVGYQFYISTLGGAILK
jgi:hypothetical protein